MEQRYSCPPRHKHATTSTCYVHHRCRCAACRGARNTYERTRRRFEGVDVWVPAGPSAKTASSPKPTPLAATRGRSAFGLSIAGTARYIETVEPPDLASGEGE